MTESQVRQITGYSAKKSQKRLNYEKQRSEVTRSRLQEHLDNTTLKLLMPLADVRGAKKKYPFQCECGKKFNARPVDIFRAGQTSCKSCATKARMAVEVTSDRWKENHERMTSQAAEANRKPDEWHEVYRICNSAKQRCSSDHRNYGGRGIEFRFASPSEMTEWVLANLGPRPSGCSIDRIDNSGHYEAGNLRWADRQTQNSNKRAYTGSVYGNRIRRLMLQTDYGYESIRTFIKDGMTDADIINRKRRPGGRPSVRHSKLRTEE